VPRGKRRQPIREQGELGPGKFKLFIRGKGWREGRLPSWGVAFLKNKPRLMANKEKKSTPSLERRKKRLHQGGCRKAEGRRKEILRVKEGICLNERSKDQALLIKKRVVTGVMTRISSGGCVPARGGLLFEAAIRLGGGQKKESNRAGGAWGGTGGCHCVEKSERSRGRIPGRSRGGSMKRLSSTGVGGGRTPAGR